MNGQYKFSTKKNEISFISQDFQLPNIIYTGC